MILRRLLSITSAVTATIAFGLGAQASELRTDVLLYLPKQLIRAAAPEFKGSYIYPAGNFTIPGQFPADVTNVQGTFDYQVASLNPLSLGHFDVDVLISNFKLTMDTFHIDQTIEQVQNGVIVRIRVKIDCSGVVVSARRSFDVTGTAQIQSPLGISVQGMTLPVDQTLWAVTASTCSSPNDLPFLEQKINETFANSADIKNYVIGKVNQKVAGWLAANRSFTQDLPAFNAKISTQAQEFVDDTDSWIVRMPLQLTTTKDCNTFKKYGTSIPAMTQEGTPPQDIVIQAPEKAMNLLAKCVHEMGGFNRVDNTKNIPAFNDLMNSALAKAAVWPDLSRFPAGSQFNMYTKTSGAVFDVTPKALPTGNAGSVYYSLNGSIISKMAYLRKGVEEPYLQFYSPLGGTIEANAKANGWDNPSSLVFQWYGAPALNVNYVFQVPKNQVSNPKIDVTKIQPELLKAVQSKVFSFSIKPYSLSATRQIQLFGLAREGSNLQIKMGIAKKP